ncbi:hypothetical protein HJG60_011002 [Phyllostomus discolor]|uniref:Uncharacterized protein n=1 Tax=Phyllostomus discolor TaxID=89673 RepID=A0A834EAE9_9CHIR|nr:hypothetical protein HJG60_011002 [Phyllostomus discolor]
MLQRGNLSPEKARDSWGTVWSFMGEGTMGLASPRILVGTGWGPTLNPPVLRTQCLPATDFCLFSLCFSAAFRKPTPRPLPASTSSSGRSACPSASPPTLTPCRPISPPPLPAHLLHAEAQGEPFLHKTSNCKYFLKMYKT